VFVIKHLGADDDGRRTERGDRSGKKK